MSRRGLRRFSPKQGAEYPGNQGVHPEPAAACGRGQGQKGEHLHHVLVVEQAAGVINVVTEAPSSTLKGSVEGSYSNLDGALSASAWRFAGYVSGPINDRLRYSFSAVTYNQGDTYKNLFPGAANANDMNRYSVRGQIEADLWQDTTLRISAIRSEVYNTKANDPDVMYYAAPGQPGGPNM